MPERSSMWAALVREVLGPRLGPRETLPLTHDPRNEYITGILAPRDARETQDIEAESELIAEELTGEDDQAGDSFTPGTGGVFSPALDPRALPRTMGLSFCVECEGAEPRIEICVTWGRYRQEEDNFTREPGFFLTGITSVETERRWSAGEGVELCMRGRKLGTAPDRWRVSLFLINTTVPENTSFPGTHEHIFQPQIRVCCNGNTAMMPLNRYSTVNNVSQDEPGGYPDMDEEDSLELLYSKRQSMARGHLTGVTWREIDPERPADPASPASGLSPLFWQDSVIVPEPQRQVFKWPDVRTEYVPSYPVEAPEMEWDTGFGPSPELNPEALSECWEPGDLRPALEPLTTGYRNWLEGKRQALKQLSESNRATASRHISECEHALTRIGEAIEMLLTDDDARLAFCFANRVMALQSRWARGAVLPWRPFQLAFILLNIPAVTVPDHGDRNICDLLWFPTGGGKTEAYLGLAAYILGLRRRRSPLDSAGHRSGDGVAVFSRYTLRLLTIQQFRRALRMITACEYLRVYGFGGNERVAGWRPEKCTVREAFPWGTSRFSVGLWVGGNVTPNSLHTITVREPGGRITSFYGALDILRGHRGDGEPAQVLSCPCCNELLAVPPEGLGPGVHRLSLVFRGTGISVPVAKDLQIDGIRVDDVAITGHPNNAYHTLRILFTVTPGNTLRAGNIDEWWNTVIAPSLRGRNVVLQSIRASHPGYFERRYMTSRRSYSPGDFEIFCPSPGCPLNGAEWAEKVPVAIDSIQLSRSADTEWQEVLPAFQVPGRPRNSCRIPIPALTVDDQVYHRCPSLVVATVDKFARLAFEPRAASMFGNVEYYHSRWGYYRENSPPVYGNLPDSIMNHPRGFSAGAPLHKQVRRFEPPDLIIQDELHLIEGPLGSMVGIYETAIDTLCRRDTPGGTVIPKYIASTATVRQAVDQVQSLFDRRLAQFPPPGILIDDNFFSRTGETHPLESGRPGRLYVGICAPGKGAQTPIVRVWSALLQAATTLRNEGAEDDALDRFWTLVGYFNAVRELAGAASLYRQDIPERLQFMAGDLARQLNESYIELSSRADSLELPGLLDRLSNQLRDGSPEDAVLATSMFGTGVDIDRLGMMVVHGQPKTTSSYIQATGRVGRQRGGLVITFFRASRPRDLDHYEFFTGYHRALYRHVEPVTVSPFSPRARERSLGPLAVILLRQADRIGDIRVAPRWRIQQRLSGGVFECAAVYMRDARRNPEVDIIPEIFERRAMQQPGGRRPQLGLTQGEMISELDLWRTLAHHNPDPDRFVYSESTLLRPPERAVVLGDPQHSIQDFDVAYKNAPQSLRDVEATTRFRG